MVHIAFDLDEGVLARFQKDPEQFTSELRIAAAVKWYELHLVSQARAAEIAGLSRAEFMDALGRYGRVALPGDGRRHRCGCGDCRR
jgi:hypothetical protein